MITEKEVAFQFTCMIIKNVVCSRLCIFVSSHLLFRLYIMAHKRLNKLLNHLDTKQSSTISTQDTIFASSDLETYDLSPLSQRVSLKGKTIFITGGSRGIGLAVAKRCARDSCNVVIAAKTAEPHPKLPGTIYTAAKEIESVNGSHCLPVICDIRKEDMVQNAVHKAVERFGGIDIVINNASAISITNTQNTTMKKYDLMHDVNARGTYLVTKYCLPHLIKSGKAGRNPHILTMSPPLNHIASTVFSNKVAYMTAKMGMSMTTLGWSDEFKRHKIGVNSIWPRTAIATAAINNVLGGAAMMKRSRTPEIHADAAYVILTQPSKFTGNFVWDEDILRGTGVSDFKKYQYDPTIHESQVAKISKWES